MGEMKKKFPHIYYDLSQNILLLSNEKKFFRLDQYSLILSASFYLKKFDVLEALKEVDFEMDDILSGSKVKLIIETFVSKIQVKLSEFIDTEVGLLDIDLESILVCMLEGMIMFFQSTRVNLMEVEIQKLFVKHLFFTYQGNVSTKMTFIHVLDKENLTENLKFKLAARHFLGNQIVRYYWTKLSKKEKLPHSKVDIDEDIGRYYWVWQMEGYRKAIKTFLFHYWDKNKENKVCKSDVQEPNFAIQNIFLRAVKHHNEIAVQFLWANHISKFEEREIILSKSISEYKSKPSHLNIVIYLILQSGKEEIIGFFEKEKLKNLMLFFNNKRFLVLFLDVLNTFSSNFGKQDYFYILQNIATTYRNKSSNEIDIDFLITFLCFIPSDKRSMLECEGSFEVYYELLRVAYEYLSATYITNILDHSPKSKISEFFQSNYGMELIKIFVRESNYELLDEILKIYFSDLEIKEVKEQFFKLKGFEVSHDLIYCGIIDLSSFMNWLSDSVDSYSIYEFKCKLPYWNNGKVVKDLLFFFRRINTKSPFPYAERVLVWCVGKENAERVKMSISFRLEEDGSPHETVILCYGNVRELVLESEWKFLSELLTWKEYTTEDKRSFGIKLLNDSDLFQKIVKKTDGLNYIYGFSGWIIEELSLEDDDSWKIFKANVFKSIKLYLNPLLTKWDLDGVKKLIIWCKAPVTKIRDLRRDIQPTLQVSKPNTEYAQEKYEEFNAWINSV